MALTRSFRDTVATRARHDPAFRAALLEEAIQAMLDGELDDAKSLLRDCINATVGFDALGQASGIAVKSLMRMVGPSGNPTLHNFTLIISAIQKQAGVRATARVYDPDAESKPVLGGAVSQVSDGEIQAL